MNLLKIITKIFNILFFLIILFFSRGLTRKNKGGRFSVVEFGSMMLVYIVNTFLIWLYGESKTMILFNARNKLEREYDKWIKDNPEIKDCALSVISFLTTNNLLDEEMVKKYLEG